MSLVYSIGEIADRLSILGLKVERLPRDSSDYERIRVQRNRSEQEWLERLSELPAAKRVEAMILFHKLCDVNARIWNLEYEIRTGGEMGLGFEEVGRRAVQIRDINLERVRTKDELNELAGDWEWDVKI